MKEAKQMGWMLLGVVVGFAIGGYVLLKIFEVTGTKLAENPTLAILVALPVLGGGLVGGGYLAQWLVYRYEKNKRKKRQEAKDAKPFAGGKKKKKK